jgi:hypothetical protein
MGCQMLKIGWVSRASARQREGRAGRCREGLFIGLYHREYHDLIFKGKVLLPIKKRVWHGISDYLLKRT